MADRKGTGKHPQKTMKEPSPHPEGGESGGQQARGPENESSDLKSREYRDKEGNIHHHTRSYGKPK